MISVISKLKWIAVVAGLICFALSMTACNGWDDRGKDEPAPQPPPNTIYEPNPNTNATEGKLAVYIFGGPKYLPVAGTEVKLFLSQQDFQNNLPLAGLITDAEGKADFGFMNFGNYYIYAFKRINNMDYQKTEVGQVQATKTLTRNLILY